VSELKARQADPKFWYEQDSQVTIFHEILNSDLPDKEKSFDRLWQDGTVTVIAGTLTTAAALSEITFHLLQQPEDLIKLKTELSKVIPEPGSLPATSKLEQLPYLTAIIKEGLRLSNGISTRLQRIATQETLIYTEKTSDAKGGRKEKHYVLRPGIPLSCTGMLIHLSPTYFKDPMSFHPQRWIDNPGLDKYLVPFSRGTRQCVGINLAYTEIYLTLATVFSQYGSEEIRFPGDKGWLELHETSYRDIEIIGDGVTPLYRADSNGVRVRVVCGGKLDK
jgi:cytochrome P450